MPTAMPLDSLLLAVATHGYLFSPPKCMHHAHPLRATTLSTHFVQTLFNFLSCTAVATAQTMSAGNALHATFMIMGAHAVILPMLIYVFMPVSGAHFNPMVTMSFVAAGRQVCSRHDVDLHRPAGCRVKGLGCTPERTAVQPTRIPVACTQTAGHLHAKG